jgi:hypothetical protein
MAISKLFKLGKAASKGKKSRTIARNSTENLQSRVSTTVPGRGLERAKNQIAVGNAKNVRSGRPNAPLMTMKGRPSVGTQKGKTTGTQAARAPRLDAPKGPSAVVRPGVRGKKQTPDMRQKALTGRISASNKRHTATTGLNPKGAELADARIKRGIQGGTSRPVKQPKSGVSAVFNTRRSMNIDIAKQKTGLRASKAAKTQKRKQDVKNLFNSPVSSVRGTGRIRNATEGMRARPQQNIVGDRIETPMTQQIKSLTSQLSNASKVGNALERRLKGGNATTRMKSRKASPESRRKKIKRVK